MRLRPKELKRFKEARTAMSMPSHLKVDYAEAYINGKRPAGVGQDEAGVASYDKAIEFNSRLSPSVSWPWSVAGPAGTI